jgi:hypothetical protein
MTIAEIRNLFAHSDTHLDFESEVIKAKCIGMELHVEKPAPGGIVGFAIKIGQNKSKRSRKPHTGTARNRYSSVAAQIRSRLIQLASNADPIPKPLDTFFVELIE